MIVYIDSDYKCHISDDGTAASVEDPFFDGKCESFIEGYRFVPAGESWTREDGEVFSGGMITPWKDYDKLEAAQAQYEADLAALEAAYREGVNSL